MAIQQQQQQLFICKSNGSEPGEKGTRADIARARGRKREKEERERERERKERVEGETWVAIPLGLEERLYFYCVSVRRANWRPTRAGHVCRNSNLEREEERRERERVNKLTEQ